MNAVEKKVQEALVVEEAAALAKLEQAVKEKAAAAAAKAKALATLFAGAVFPLSSTPDTEVPTKVRISCVGGVSQASLSAATSDEKAAAIFGLVKDLAKLAGDFLLSVKLWGVFDTQRNFLTEKTLNPVIWNTLQRGDVFVAYVKTSGSKTTSRSISWEIDLIDAIKFAESLKNTSTEKVAIATERVAIF